MKIFFPNAEKAKSVRELLVMGYNNLEMEDNFMLFTTTYKDKDLTTMQCLRARRSFLDLVLIAKTYFPDTTDEEVAYIHFK